jgi:hypothetical protein
LVDGYASIDLGAILQSACDQLTMAFGPVPNGDPACNSYAPIIPVATPAPCVDDMQLFTRPIDGFVGFLGSHTYLELTTTSGGILDTIEGLPFVLQAGGAQMLVGVVDPGGTGTANPSGDKNFGGVLPIPCSTVSSLVSAADNFTPVLYTALAGVLGPNLPSGANSNTFMAWLLKTTGLLFYYPAQPPGAYGWYNSIPNP